MEDTQFCKKMVRLGKGEMVTLALDNSQVEKFARSIERFEWTFDKFEDPLMYPGTNTEPALAANFFFFLVAIDHRTHPVGQTFRGIVNGNELTGAELLWALAKIRFDTDPPFFSPENLSSVSLDEVINVFRVKEPKPMVVDGPEERAALLRDCARKLRSNFSGSILNMVSVSEGWLVREDGRGMLALLKQFKAYEDPMSKKAFLLIKFLERRRFVVVRDPSNLHVPVDNILLRLALRTGMVKVQTKDLEQKIRSGTEVAQKDDQILREFTLRACDMVAHLLKMNATKLDDILWEFGRVHCKLPTPICNKLPDPSHCRPYRMIRSGPIGECPFGQGCKGYQNPEAWELKEPNFKTLFY